MARARLPHEAKKPPAFAGGAVLCAGLLGDAVCPVAPLGLVGFDDETHFGFDGSADESPMLCGCQSVALAISARVAPFLRRSRSNTMAFLLPSRAGAASLALAVLAALAFFGAPLGALGAGVAASWAAVAVSGAAPSSPWMAFQIRVTALLRFVNFLTGFRSPANPATPAKPFQIWTRRSVGQLAASLASSFSVAKCSWPSGSARRREGGDGGCRYLSRKVSW